MIAIAWLIRSHHDRIRVQGSWPITVGEVRELLPEAHRLAVDSGPKQGLRVLDADGDQIGYAMRTMPHAREIIGYSGPTDVLVVFDEEDKGVGISLRHSYDTPSHVDDVKMEFLFLESWNGRTMQEIADITDLGDAEIYAVSGATRTSEAVAESVNYRVRMTKDAEATIDSGVSVRWQDFVLILILVIGAVFAFMKNKSVQKWRWIYSLTTIGVLGLWMGDLIAQSLLVGWVESRIPWSATPGLVIFVAAAFLIPWFTKQPIYCQFICPHGNLQRWTMKWLPAKWTKRLSKDDKWIGKSIPVLLLALVIAVSFLQLDFDLAGIEPFDAYLIKSAGIATIVVAVIGILLSLIFPMAYCKYGCPTGWLLEFVRRRSGKDRFSGRDWIGVGLLGLAVALYLIPQEVFLG